MLDAEWAGVEWASQREENHGAGQAPCPLPAAAGPASCPPRDDHELTPQAQPRERIVTRMGGDRVSGLRERSE